jgi:hypothetical protein
MVPKLKTALSTEEVLKLHLHFWRVTSDKVSAQLQPLQLLSQHTNCRPPQRASVEKEAVQSDMSSTLV